jgi:tetratricopeptide (TPR) repeat protein
VERARGVKSSHLLAVAMMTEGRAAQRLSRPADAGPLFADARKLYESIGDLGGVSDALRAQAVLLLGQDSLNDAFERADEALKVATSIQDRRSIVECWIVRSNALRRLRRLPESRIDAESAVAESRKTGYKSALGRALVALGSTERAQRNIPDARTHLEEAQRIGREIGEPGVTKSAETALASLGR